MHTVTPTRASTVMSRRRLRARLELDREELGNAYEELLRHFPDEPYRQRLGSIAERLRQTRHRLVADRGIGSGYRSPD